MRHASPCLLLIAALAAPIVGQAQEQVASVNFPTRDSVTAPVPAAPADDKAPAAPRNWFGSELGYLRWSSVTGDWAGLRTSLEDRGFVFSATYTYDASSNVSGGAKQGSAMRGLLMGQLSMDLGKFLPLKGTKAAVSYAYLGGDNGSDFAGDIQAFSNIDGDPFSHFYEAWVEQTIGDDVVRLKVGQVDANTEFAVVGPAGDFINASAGFSPTILGLPTYPDPKMSVNLFVTPVSWLTLSAGTYAGTFDPASDSTGTVSDQFSIGQVSTSWKSLGKYGAGKFGFGVWHHSGMAARFDGEFSQGAEGWWATAEQRFAGHEATDDSPASGVQFFAKYGSAPGMLSVFQQHLMVGVVFDGGLRSGSEDALGVAATHVDLSDVPAAGTPLDETTLEAYYKVKLFGFATIRPNLQYVINPSGDPSRASSMVFTLRTSIAY